MADLKGVADDSSVAEDSGAPAVAIYDATPRLEVRPPPNNNNTHTLQFPSGLMQRRFELQWPLLKQLAPCFVGGTPGGAGRGCARRWRHDYGARVSTPRCCRGLLLERYFYLPLIKGSSAASKLIHFM